MPTPITILARERAKAFRQSFNETSRTLFSSGTDNKLYHPGEYGSYRERLLKHLLKSFLPAYLEISDGFIVSSDGKRSTQADVVIFDAAETPNIETGDLRRFFPIETTSGVGEVKSILTVKLLSEALVKLSRIKSMRLSPPPILVPTRPTWRVQEVNMSQMEALWHFGRAQLEKPPEERESVTPARFVEFLQKSYDPIENHWQNIVSFLVCAKIEMDKADTFKQIVERIVRERASEPEFAMRHNMFLSLEDGYQSYAINGHVPVFYPRLYNPAIGVCAATGIRIVEANDECDHIIAFIADLSGAVVASAIYPFTVASHFDIQSHFSHGA